MKQTVNYQPWDKYEQDLEIFTSRFLENQLKPMCHEKIMDLSVSFAYSDEPIPFEELGSADFVPLPIGGVWARENFACAWFHLTGKLPEGTDRENLYLDFENDGEGMLVDANGSALKGFTAGSAVFGVVDSSVEKRYYPLKDLIDQAGNIDLYIDGASNSLLGEYVYDCSRLKTAAVVRRNDRMMSIYWDFDVLFDYVKGVTAEDPYKYTILNGLHKVRNLIVYQDPDMYEKAEALLQELKSLPGDEKLQVTAVGHSHLDLGWLWPIRESKRKAKRTFANFVYLLERYPDFHVVIPQPQQLEWMKELDPKLYGKLKKYAQEGRVEIIGGGWVENDTNIPGEESLVRQELYGQKYWQEEFGHYVRMRWLPDAFGYTGSLPQVLKLSGQDNFMTIKISWSNRTIFPYNTFRWAGIDGSEVTVHMPPEGNYNSVGGPRALMTAKKGLKKTDPQDKMMVVYGVGDGGGGPSETIVERNLRTADIPYLPKVKMGRAQDYFDTLDPKTMPVYQGEMYLERHRATYTSQSNNKNYNRTFEEKMIALEMLLSSLGSYGHPDEINKMWKEVLLYQFHDILPGSCIERVYRETDVAYTNILKRVDEMAEEMGASFTPDCGKGLLNFRGQPMTKLTPAGEGYLLYQGSESVIAPVSYADPVCSDHIDTLKTDHFTVKLASDGSFDSIVLNATGEVAVEKANRLRVFIDAGDAWDFDDDYRDQPERYMELEKTQVRDFGDVTEVRQHYRFLESTLVQTIVVHKALPMIYITHDVDWKHNGYMLRAEFLPKAWSDTVSSDIQFGYLGRPTTDDTPHDAAQYEICCQKWMDISDEKQGLAIFNDAKSGFMAKEHILSVDLLRSTEYPCVSGDQGHSHYAYAIYPHAGGFDPVAIDQMAQQYAERHLFGSVEAKIPVFSSEQVQVTAFKPAYDGNGFILRAFERAGKTVETAMQIPAGFKLVGEVNLLEDPMGECSEKVSFKPFQIRSFRFTKN